MDTTKQIVTPCDYCFGVKDNQPKPLTREIFETLLDDMNVAFLCEKVREHKPDASRYKSQLAAITWQSRFEGKIRSDANLCQEEGAEKAFSWAKAQAHQRAQRWKNMQEEQDKNPAAVNPADDLGIIAIHISPSETGVHVVAACSPFCKTIEEQQARLARLLGTSYDPVCKDWARIFFIVPRKEWYYLDRETLFCD